jgi:hypothetical protein
MLVSDVLVSDVPLGKPLGTGPAITKPTGGQTINLTAGKCPCRLAEPAHAAHGRPTSDSHAAGLHLGRGAAAVGCRGWQHCRQQLSPALGNARLARQATRHDAEASARWALCVDVCSISACYTLKGYAGLSSLPCMLVQKPHSVCTSQCCGLGSRTRRMARGERGQPESVAKCPWNKSTREACRSTGKPQSEPRQLAVPGFGAGGGGTCPREQQDAASAAAPACTSSELGPRCTMPPTGARCASLAAPPPCCACWGPC